MHLINLFSMKGDVCRCVCSGNLLNIKVHESTIRRRQKEYGLFQLVSACFVATLQSLSVHEHLCVPKYSMVKYEAIGLKMGHTAGQ